MLQGSSVTKAEKQEVCLIAFLNNRKRNCLNVQEYSIQNEIRISLLACDIPEFITVNRMQNTIKTVFNELGGLHLKKKICFCFIYPIYKEKR
jgi:predicted PolB exonuclease-like 3'-5' exonuclease